jgi:O-antigen/teichoic acid export membrane protein
MISVIQQFLAKDNLRIRFFKDAGGSFVIQTAFAGFSFLNAVVFARIMGAINYGAFANAMAWVSILVILATFGFTTLIVRDISIYNSKREWPLLRGLLRFSDRFVLILALLIALVVFLIAGVIFNQPDQAIMRGTLRVAVFFVPLFSLLLNYRRCSSVPASSL